MKTCRDCALLIVTYRHDIETPGNEYPCWCTAPRFRHLPTHQDVDSPAAETCPAFTDKGRAVCAPGFF